jgi:methionyl-tRNA formyltransferase
VRPDHTFSTLRGELVQASLTPLVRAVTQGCSQGTPQSGVATHAAKIDPAELQIRFTKTAREITALARLETAWFTYTNDHGSTMRVRVVSAVEVVARGEPGTVVDVSRDGVVVACGDTAVRLVTVQPAGKSPMPAGAWANGARLPASLA